MRRYLPVVVLFVLAPIIAELLFGATPLSNIDSFPLGLLIYGGGAVLIRELARRRGPGWGRIALMGAAYGIVEEGLALQSMFDPTLFNAADYGGRLFGVNWIWSEWTVGYHIIWSITAPILLVELLFPTRRAEPWLGRVGVAIDGVLYVLGVAAYVAIFRFVVAPDFHAPIVLPIMAVLVVVVLVAPALAWPTSPEAVPEPITRQNAPPPWLVGGVGLLAAAAWFVLLSLPTAWRTDGLALTALVGALALAAIIGLLLRQWSAAPGWNDLHRLALVWGALLVDMGMGYFRITAGNPTDQMAQGVMSLVTIVLLAIFTWRVRQRQAAAGAQKIARQDLLG